MKSFASTPLENHLSETYLDSEKLILALRKHDFERIMFPLFKRVQEYIEKKQFESIPRIVGAILTTVNDKLAQVQGEDKSLLEFISSELFMGQISVLQQSPEGRQCWQLCQETLKETCEIKGYDFEQLSKLLRVDFIKKPQNRDVKIISNPPYYLWLASKHDLHELIADLKDKKWIANKKDFEKLFAPIINENFTFVASRDKIEYLLVLFSELYSKKLIQVKNGKGHFMPLTIFGKVDSGEKLFSKEPKRYMDILKRNEALHELISKEVQRITSHIKMK